MGTKKKTKLIVMIPPPIPNLLRGVIFIAAGLLYLIAVFFKYQEDITLGIVLIVLGILFIMAPYLRKRKKK